MASPVNVCHIPLEWSWEPLTFPADELKEKFAPFTEIIIRKVTKLVSFGTLFPLSTIKMIKSTPFVTLLLLLLLTLSLALPSPENGMQETPEPNQATPRLRRLTKESGMMGMPRKGMKSKKVEDMMEPMPTPMPTLPPASGGGRDDTGGTGIGGGGGGGGIPVPSTPRSCPTPNSPGYQANPDVVPCNVNADCDGANIKGGDNGVCCLHPMCICGAAIPDPSPYVVACTAN